MREHVCGSLKAECPGCLHEEIAGLRRMLALTVLRMGGEVEIAAGEIDRLLDQTTLNTLIDGPTGNLKIFVTGGKS